MRKISIIILFIGSLFAKSDVMLPPYAETFQKERLEVLEVKTEINWKNSNMSNEEAEYCKTQFLPKDSKQMEKYLKQHTIVWSLHYFSGDRCIIYRGKVKFAGKIWDFVSIGGQTTFTRGNEYVDLVCESAQCLPRAEIDAE